MSDIRKTDDFGIELPPLCVYIKQILDEYPEGGQILKISDNDELLQNADDAGAKKVIYLYDKTSYPTDQLYRNSLKQFSGPALYVYNDAIFTDEDWNNIQKPQQSGKIEDPTKVGQFGLGFISVYHMTDMPSVLSGGHVGFFDPHERHFVRVVPNEGAVDKRGKRWPLSNDLIRSDFKDQFLPFVNKVFECSEDDFKRGHFSGTIFRFPLRNKESDKSEISSALYNDERISDLFQSFETDAEISLLFLKNVESVSVFQKVDRKSNASAKLLFQVEVSPDSLSRLRSERSKFMSKKDEKKSLSRCRVRIRNSSSQANDSDYVIVNFLRRSPRLQVLMNDVNYLPWVGAAARIETDSVKDGRVFCFLPLPEGELTHLPVHVHGYLAVGKNRRSIKWPDHDSEHDKPAEWNKQLVEDNFGVAFAELIKEAIRSGVSPERVYQLWPDVDSLNGAWKKAIKRAVKILGNEAILYSMAADGESWKSPADIYVDTEQDALIQKVMTHDKKRGHPVVHVPSNVLRALEWADVDVQKVTPGIIREAIRNDPLHWLTREEKMSLLDYILSDEAFTDLEGIHLLPLQNRKFTAFSNKYSTQIYLQSENVPTDIFPSMESRFCSSDCPDELQSNEAISATQLKKLRQTDVPSILREVLPYDWVHGSGVIIWTSGLNVPRIDWLGNLWKWLQCTSLSLKNFAGLPFIQIKQSRSQIYLARLHQNTMLYNKDTRYSGSNKVLSNNVCTFLESIGAVVVKEESLPAYILQHKEMSTYIRPGNGEGVMYILERLGQSSHLPDKVAQASPTVKRDLALLLSSEISSFPYRWTQLIRTLPIFATNKGTYVAADDCDDAVPSGLYGIPIRGNQLKTRLVVLDVATSRLASGIGMETFSKHKLVKLCVLPYVSRRRVFSNQECDKLMEWVLQEAIFYDDVKDVKFIPTSNGEYASPNTLYDPNSRLLKELFQGYSVFPTGIYAKGRLLKHLSLAGLKSEEDVTANDLLDMATAIANSNNQSRSKTFLKYISQHSQILKVKVSHLRKARELGTFLSEIEWVACEQAPPSSYSKSAPWYGSTRNKLHAPNQVKMITASPLVGTVFPILHLERCHDTFAKYFGWSNDTSTCSVSDVATHLINLSRCVKVKRDMSPMINRIYKFLAGKYEENRQNLLAVGSHLHGKSWVWHGSGFTTPDRIAFTSVIHLGHLKSQLFLIPPELQDEDMEQVKSMLINLGVREAFAAEDFLNILENLQREHEKKPLSSTDLEAVLDIINALIATENSEEMVSIRKRIYVPDLHRVLRPCAQLVYHDVTQKEDVEGHLEGFVFTHENVTGHQAKLLEIRTRRDIELDQCSDDAGFEHPFGQQEKLTTRLRGILSEYSHNPDVLKELLQNADDAGASDIHVVYDPREHGGSKISGEEWRPVHSLPALCVYNDKPFTKEDIKGIQNVGVGGKISDTTTTGRFGIGFNSVYHLTDCPTFLTQNMTKLCIFDPHVKYVPRATAKYPGKLYSNDDGHFLEKFPDMTQGYLQGYKEFNLQRGTMFRFPLRPEDMASEISSKSYNSDKVEELLKEFEGVSKEALLFLNNVAKISISEIDQKTGKLKLRYSVTADISPNDRAKRSELGKHLITHKSRSVREIPEINRVYSINISDSKKTNESWLISQSIGLDQSVEIPEDECDPTEFMSKSYLPRGGAAVCVRGSSQAASTKAFCFLPLAIKTHLPVHVNGTFRLDQSRQHLKKGDSKDRMHKWNKLLAMYVIGPAYAYLIEECSYIYQRSFSLNEVNQKISNVRYEELFPTLATSSVMSPKLYGVWKLIAESVLKYIGRNDMKVLPVIQDYDIKTTKYTVEWFSPNVVLGDPHSSAFFDDLSKLDTVSAHPTKAPLFRIFLRETGFNLISCKEDIGKSFILEEVGVAAEFVSSEVCVDHVRNTHMPVIPCRVEQSPFRSSKVLDVVLEYCLNGIDTLEDLRGMPLQLDGDNVLSVFSEDNPKYLSYDLPLLPKLGVLFLHIDSVSLLTRWAQNIIKKEVMEKEEEKRKEMEKKKTEERENEKEQMRRAKMGIRKGKIFHPSKDHNVEEKPSKEEKEKEVEDRRTEILYQAGILREFNIPELAKYMHTNFPPNWKNPSKHLKWVCRQEGDPPKWVCKENGGLPHPHWLKCFWNYILQHCTGDDLLGLQALAEWPVIPTKSQRLVSLSMSKTVMFHDVFSECYKVSVLNVLQKLGCTVVDEGKLLDYYMTSRSSGFDKNVLRRALVGPNSRNDVLKLLKYVIDNEWGADKPCELSPSECDTILSYLQEGEEKLSASEIQIIKQLPIFCLANGGTTGRSVNGYSRCYTIEENANQSNQSSTLDLVTEKANVAFLKHDKNLNRLYEMLGIEPITLPGVYLELILPRLKECDLDERLRYIICIRDEIMPHASEKEQEQMKQKLGQVAFIENLHGEAKPPSCFYDPLQSIFTDLLEPVLILPGRFAEYKWRHFLLDIGMKSKITRDMFILLARKIEEKSTKVNDAEEIEALRNVSIELLKELQHNEDLLESTTLSTISEISFVPSVQIDQRYPEHYITTEVDRSDFICFQEALPEKHADLIWTVAYLIDARAVPRNTHTFYSETYPRKKLREMNIHEHLGIVSEPSLTAVLRHTNLLCTQMKAAEKSGVCEESEAERKDAHLGLLKTVTEIMQYLMNNSDGNEKQIKTELGQTPLCIVGDNEDKLVRANQLAFELGKTTEEYLRPYLYRAPRHLGEFDDVLRVIGAEETLTLWQLAMVLDEIHKECSEEPMNDCQKRCAYAAVRTLLLLLADERDECQEYDFTLFLPTRENKLRPSTSLRYFDFDETPSTSTVEDCDLVASVKEMFSGFEDTVPLGTTNYSEMLELLPAVLRPEKIATQEKPLDSNVPCIGGPQCHILEQLREIVQSPDLQIYLLRIICHQTKKNPTVEIQQKIAALRRFDSFVCVQELKTAFYDSSEQLLYINTRSRDILLSTSGSEDQQFVLNIGHADISEDTESGSIYFLPLARSIDRICKLGLDKFHVCILKDVLLASPAQRARVLETYEIQEYNHLLSVRLGSVVPNDIRLIQGDGGSQRFQQGEIVAYKQSDDEELIFAKILEEVVSGGSEEAENACWKYKIDIGERGKIVVSAETLFRFSRASESDDRQGVDEAINSNISSGSRSSTHTPHLSYTYQHTPNPEKARLWFRQAQEDVETVKLLLQNGSTTSLAWQAFILHQAAEKALKAAIYQFLGTHTRDHNLYTLLSDLSEHKTGGMYAERLRVHVSPLLSGGCDAVRPRYPEFSSTKTTGEIYRDIPFDTTKALRVCESIFDIVNEIVC